LVGRFQLLGVKPDPFDQFVERSRQGANLILAGDGDGNGKIAFLGHLIGGVGQVLNRLGDMTTYPGPHNRRDRGAC
jgi:hypothetical protein